LELPEDDETEEEEDDVAEVTVADLLDFAEACGITIPAKTKTLAGIKKELLEYSVSKSSLEKEDIDLITRAGLKAMLTK
jgi:hypothetical protein